MDKINGRKMDPSMKMWMNAYIFLLGFQYKIPQQALFLQISGKCKLTELH